MLFVVPTVQQPRSPYGGSAPRPPVNQGWHPPLVPPEEYVAPGYLHPVSSGVPSFGHLYGPATPNLDAGPYVNERGGAGGGGRGRGAGPGGRGGRGRGGALSFFMCVRSEVVCSWLRRAGLAVCVCIRRKETTCVSVDLVLVSCLVCLSDQTRGLFGGRPILDSISVTESATMSGHCCMLFPFFPVVHSVAACFASFLFLTALCIY